jgi:hypothetical protein
MEQNTSWEAGSRSDSQEILELLWNGNWSSVFIKSRVFVYCLSDY